MKSRLETDSYGRKKVYDACVEPCAMKKACASLAGNGPDQLSIT